jgi:hypothetical protein
LHGVKNTTLRTVHPRWWRSERFRTGMACQLGLGVGVGLGILGGPNGGGG